MKEFKKIFFESVGFLVGLTIAILMMPIALPIAMYKSIVNSKRNKNEK